MRLIVLMILVTVASTALLVAVGLKALRIVQCSLSKRYHRRIEPALEEFSNASERAPELERLRLWEKDRFLAPLMVERMALLRGEDRERLARLAARLGLVDHYLRALFSRRRWSRARAAENLGYFGGEAVVEPLGALLSDEDETVRAVTARALARIGTEYAAEALVRTLDDPSELTRLRAAENLERLGDLAVAPLSGLLLTLSPPGAAMAAEVLGNLRSRYARPALGSVLLHTRDEDVQAQATLALGKIGDPDDAPFVLRSAGSDSRAVKALAAKALGLMGETSTLPTLKKLAGDPEWSVRLNACEALANIGPAGERTLVRILKSDDRYARDQAAATLEARSITLRAVRNLPKSGQRGERARVLIRAVLRSGSTRYLRSLLETLPDDERQALEDLLEANDRLTGALTPTGLWSRRLHRTLSRTRESA